MHPTLARSYKSNFTPSLAWENNEQVDIALQNTIGSDSKTLEFDLFYHDHLNHVSFLTYILTLKIQLHSGQNRRKSSL